MKRIITCDCGEPLMTPVELTSGTCYLCHFSPPERTPEPVSEGVLLAILRKGFIAGKEAAFRDRANGATWAASAGTNHCAELEEEAREIAESEHIRPEDWMARVLSGDIPPHDGRRCPECGYPLTAENVWRGLWWLCPVCDTADKGEDEWRREQDEEGDE